MANEVEKVNAIAIADIEKINGKTDANIEKINALELTGISYPTHSGGDSVSTSGVYKFVTFTSSGTFAFTAGGAGLDNTLDYLIIAGGASGGQGNNGVGAGGGGAGGYRTGTVTGSTQSYTITIGA